MVEEIQARGGQGVPVQVPLKHFKPYKKARAVDAGKPFQNSLLTLVGKPGAHPSGTGLTYYFKNMSECYKTIYSRNLQIFVLIYSDCPWEGFPA